MEELLKTLRRGEKRSARPWGLGAKVESMGMGQVKADGPIDGFT